MQFDTRFLIIFGVTLVAVVVAVMLGQWVLASLRRSGLLKFLEDDRSPIQEERPAIEILLDDPDEARQKGALRGLAVFRTLQESLLDTSGLGWTVEMLLLYTAGGTVIGALLGFLLPILVTREFSMIVFAFAGFAGPYVYAARKRAARLRQFEEQLPEALDFVARAMRAGHAFSVALEMLAAESQEPIRSEFRQVFNEMNLGSSLDSALKGLATRVDIIDIKFFVSAVLLQRETGGSLGEVLSKLSHTIRERFRLKGHVRALTAHSRLTAVVLSAMPIVVVMLLSAAQPSYLRILAVDPLGRFLAIAAVIAQVMAYIVIKRLVAIKI